MPEGDTIAKVAAAIAGYLEGRTLVAAHAAHGRALPLAGSRVTGVRAHGKHLFIALEDGRELRSHLGMHGSWHHYRQGAPRPPRRGIASVVLETTADVLVCFNAKEVELLRAESVRRRVLDSRLGPDLARTGVDFEGLERAARAWHVPEAILADVLLDQRVAAGLGNVYKCEVAFLEGVHPASALGTLPEGSLARMYALGSDLIRRNLGGGARTTRSVADGRGRLWVYGRAGRECLRCVEPVAAARIGARPRITYWCPACQPDGTAAAARAGAASRGSRARSDPA